MKTAIYPFGYECIQQWSLSEGDHLFLNSQKPHTSPRGLFSISLSP
ncbi:hypothetical protein PAECIP111802_05040 [Paenibacillus allorhizosphaerae]|uniref:Uncharacterized protein n=1 Tax=Paenibacillus allorhizosphaerae TaxID=2849866 RepID=A0ABN7TTU1_9BACL|nr:hypothetical protein PAECIP111802_05040 [Paenibacillus allorhizosphaerae]